MHIHPSLLLGCVIKSRWDIECIYTRLDCLAVLLNPVGILNAISRLAVLLNPVGILNAISRLAVLLNPVGILNTISRLAVLLNPVGILNANSHVHDAGNGIAERAELEGFAEVAGAVSEEGWIGFVYPVDMG